MSEREARLRQIFSQGAKHEEDLTLKKPEHWREHGNIETRSALARDKAQRLYEEQFIDRVNKNVEDLARRNSRQRQELKPPGMSNDLPTLKALRAQAVRIVNDRHEQRLIRIKLAEDKLKQQHQRRVKREQ
jgi:hypothetical protein